MDFLESERIGPGTIGLTNAGKILDWHIAKNYDKKTAKKIISFINKFTLSARIIHENINGESKQEILLIIRKHYNEKMTEKFKKIVDPFCFSLMQNYVATITKGNFSPTTKTQVSLARNNSNYKKDENI